MKGSILITMLMSCALTCACQTTAPPPYALIASNFRDSYKGLRLKGGACALQVDSASHAESLTVYIGDRNSAVLRVDVGPLAQSLYPRGFSDAPYTGIGRYVHAGVLIINGNDHIYGLGTVLVTGTGLYELEGRFFLNDQVAYGRFHCPFVQFDPASQAAAGR